ncbi:MAG: hypothetical protein Q7U53_12520 [Anaerolineaceae bacterium]|nr:hypothetical protein [Anaerolineaceae bacterium]
MKDLRMTFYSFLSDPDQFSQLLFQKMVSINKGINHLELYEFQYALGNITPAKGWDSIAPEKKEQLQSNCTNPEFFSSIQLKSICNNKIVLDETLLQLTQMIMVGLVSDEYSIDWVNSHFYFDIRAFCFFIRTNYFNNTILEHFGNEPYCSFDPKQIHLESLQEIGYKEFKQANQEVDQALLQAISGLIQKSGIPVLLSLTGPTGAGKTEITERINEFLRNQGMQITTIEMDNFYKDREFRDGRVHDKHVIHFELFINAMQDLLNGKSVSIPRYNFYLATSSHDLNGNLRLGQIPLIIEPADVIFLEGNFPFHIPELSDLITLRIVYLTDDPIRLKRKWRRDIDYRKKYDPIAFVNRYFRTQFIRAQEIYLPLMEVCDLVVDTTGARLWMVPEKQKEIETGSK